MGSTGATCPSGASAPSQLAKSDWLLVRGRPRQLEDFALPDNRDPGFGILRAALPFPPVMPLRFAKPLSGFGWSKAKLPVCPNYPSHRLQKLGDAGFDQPGLLDMFS
jgi:hypothetical protein